MVTKSYGLFVQVDGRWERVRTIEARDYPEALRLAIACLSPAHYDKPIRLDRESEQARRAADNGGGDK